MSEFLSVDAFSKRAGVSTTTIYKMIEKGVIKTEEVRRGFSTSKKIPESELKRLGYLN